VFALNAPPGRVDPLGLTSLTHVEQGIAFYTWHMGWIDKQHIAENSSLKAAWSKLKSAPANSVTCFPLSMAQAGKASAGTFCLRAQPDDTNKKNQLLLAWMAISHQFEAYQGKGVQSSVLVNKLYGLLAFLWGKGESDKVPSSFSTEDLVSNLVSFYATVEGKPAQDLLNEHAGRFDAKDEALISTAIWIFGLKPQPGYENWNPVYFDHEAFMKLDFDLKKDTFAPISKEFYVTGQEAQNRLQKYIKKYGQPTFPAFFRQYKPMSDGYIQIQLRNR
jgi:hypothetical protein